MALQVVRSALYMDLPYDMDPAELAAYSRALLDPTELKAIDDWARERFGSRPTVLNGGLKARPRAPSHTTFNSKNTDIGIPSPSASEHGELNNSCVVTAGGPGSQAFTSQKVSRKASSGRLSKSTKNDRKSRKVNWRTARSKDQFSESAVELDRTGTNALLTKSRTPSIQGPGSERPEGSLSLDSAGTPKRKRHFAEEDDEKPQRKRSRGDSGSDVTDTEAAFKTDPTANNRKPHNMTSSIEDWLCNQGPDYEPLDTPPNGLNDGKPPSKTKVEADTSGWGSTTKLDTRIVATGQSTVLMVPEIAQGSSIDPTTSAPSTECCLPKTSAPCQPQKTSQGARIKKSASLLGSQPACGVSKNPEKKETKKRRDIHRMDVKTLECAYEATRAYCRALGLKRNILNYANILLHDVFFDAELKDRPTHTLITGCIAIACTEKKSPQKWPDIFALTNESKLECGKTMMKLCPRYSPMPPDPIQQRQRPSATA